MQSLKATIHCDNCGKTQDLFPDRIDYHAAIEIAKEMGWIVYCSLHFCCRECLKAYQDNTFERDR